MKGIPALRKLLENGDYMYKVDLKDTYVVVPIHQSSRDSLTFLHRDIVYRYKSLAFWLQCCTSCILKTDEICLGTSSKRGNQICILPRRHMYVGKDERRDADPCLTYDIPFTRIGISNQRRKEYISSSTSIVIPWVPIQFKRNNDTGPTGKDTKTEHANKTTI